MENKSKHIAKAIMPAPVMINPTIKAMGISIIENLLIFYALPRKKFHAAPFYVFISINTYERKGKNEPIL